MGAGRGAVLNHTNVCGDGQRVNRSDKGQADGDVKTIHAP